MVLQVRPEAAADRASVRRLLLAAFSGPAEAELVDRLRAEGDAALALVAVAGGGAVVGHVMFSVLAAPFPALALAPLAVDAAWRRQGIGARLVEAGIAAARACDWAGVFVLGDPAYYRRFGFAADLAAGFDCAYAGPYLMALALRGTTLPTATGHLGYAPAFAAFA